MFPENVFFISMVFLKLIATGRLLKAKMFWVTKICPVPKMDLQTPPLSGVVQISGKMLTLLNISDFPEFYFLSYGWLHLRWHNWCATNQEKKLFKSGLIYRKDEHCSDNDFLVLEFFFVRLLVFEIWSILMHQNRPYLKNWKSHEQKELMN